MEAILDFKNICGRGHQPTKKVQSSTRRSILTCGTGIIQLHHASHPLLWTPLHYEPCCFAASELTLAAEEIW